MTINEDDYLAHYGTPRKSGRYPWGSGGNETDTRSQDFLGMIGDLKSEGLSDKEIYQGLGMSSTEFRARKSNARAEKRQSNIAMAQRLKDKGYGSSEIGRRMGVSESVVRTWLAPGAKEKADVLQTTADTLRRQVAEKTYVDVGAGTENYMGVSQVRLNTALAILKDEGYSVVEVKVPQLGTQFDTRVKVLIPPGHTQKDAWMNQDKIRLVNEWSEDGGRTVKGIQPPISLHPDRVSIKYGSEGGAKADGVMYVRPGVEDLSLGNSNYAQVRVLVGKDRYLKGMAMYNDSLPDGVDVLFHTNKESTGNKLDVLKPVEKNADKTNPFGANLQRQILGKDDRVTSVMNIVNDEGDWSNWGSSIASQMLSKQSPALAKSQLDMTFENRKKEFDEIQTLTNPTVKKRLLKAFADSTDSSAVHLEAASFERQSWHAILPIERMPINQIYAPTFNDGERVALIRYPHGGTFEIPDLIVNNKHAQAKKLIGPKAKHAVGIHHSVAERLSGADFDGDTVLVIPNASGKIKMSPALEGLKNFSPTREYPEYPGMPKMSSERKQQEMGKISNLITDMTVKGAPPEHLARAVKHSMVVIDAEKHNLNFKESEKVNGIAALKAEYQGSSRSGASTIISRAGSEKRVLERRLARVSEGGPIDTKTGAIRYTPTGRTTTNRQGVVIPRTMNSTKLAETTDAHTLLSSKPTRMELLYADHSNRLKALANQARLAEFNTPRLKKSASAKEAYKKEVASLNSKLALARMNKPLERQAQVLGNANYRLKVQANPNMDKETKKKEQYRALKEARIRTGAEKHRIEITQDEWDAIQAGAISDSRLNDILDSAKMDVVRELATPRPPKLMSSAKTKRAQSMLASGYTRAEVAKHLGVSLTTLDTATVGE